MTVRRPPIYERDRLDIVDPDTSLRLDPGLLASFPAGYRHLGYVQDSAGETVRRDLPALTGPRGSTALHRGPVLAFRLPPLRATPPPYSPSSDGACAGPGGVSMTLSSGAGSGLRALGVGLSVRLAVAAHGVEDVDASAG
jgi:hypothetical protein